MSLSNATQSPTRKQNISVDSCAVEKARISSLHSALLRVAASTGLHYSAFEKPNPWYESGRDPREYSPYRPYEKLQAMVRDVTRSVANKGSASDRDNARKAVVGFYEMLKEDALEFIGTESESDVLALTIESEKEIGELRCAELRAFSSQQPQAFAQAAEEASDVITLAEQLKASLRQTGRRLFNNKRLSVVR